MPSALDKCLCNLGFASIIFYYYECNIIVQCITLNRVQQCKMSEWQGLFLMVMILACAQVYSSPTQLQTALLTNGSAMCHHPWTLQYNKDNTTHVGCECGVSLEGIVRCDPVSFKLEVLYCYCLTYSEILDATVLGYCLTTCHGKHTATAIDAHNVSDLDGIVCGSLQRT